jgi:hypothetical protein
MVFIVLPAENFSINQIKDDRIAHTIASQNGMILWLLIVGRELEI